MKYEGQGLNTFVSQVGFFVASFCKSVSKKGGSLNPFVSQVGFFTNARSRVH